MPKKLLEDLKKIKTRPKTEQRTGTRSEVRISTGHTVTKERRGQTILHSDFKTKFSREDTGHSSVPLKKHGRRLKYAIWSIALISVVFLFFTISTLNGSAEVTVKPKFKDIALNKNFSATKDSATTNLPFDLVVISGEESKNMEADGEKDISEKAVGVVNIYNSFSTSSQVLSINTRLEGSNRKIYKTQNRTIVPGKSKTGTPGSVEVKIYANLAGAGYNSAPIDFKIAGFKGTPKYSQFYGRSKGDITGGFVGKSYVLSFAEREKAVKDLTAILRTKLIKKATDQIPSGFILFKDASFLKVDDKINDEASSAMTEVSKEDKLVPIKVTGTLSGILFDEKKLIEKIALATIDKYDGSEIHIPSIRDLNFSLPKEVVLSISPDTKNINFNLSGPIKIIWNVDSGKLVNDLLGKSKKDFALIILGYNNIDSANFNIRPFWLRSFADKDENIKVIVTDP